MSMCYTGHYTIQHSPGVSQIFAFIVLAPSSLQSEQHLFDPAMQHSAYPDGAADETVSVVDFENSFKQLVSGHLVCCHLTLQQVHRL